MFDFRLIRWVVTAPLGGFLLILLFFFLNDDGSVYQSSDFSTTAPDTFQLASNDIHCFMNE